jgi:predicted transcriptional regulator
MRWRKTLPNTKADSHTLEGPSEELVALAVLMLRRQADSQSELAREMHAVGFTTARIATLLGTTPNTINQAIQKAKRAKPPARAKGKAKSRA